MTDAERLQRIDEWERSLFPKDEERWVKVKYINPEKCWGSIRLDGKSGEEQGYIFTAISTVKEYIPNIEGLLELKKSLIHMNPYQEFDKETMLQMIDLQIKSVEDKYLIE